MIGKTKIVCTIGPASGSRSMLKKLIRQGMDVARLNFSHGAHSEHQKVIDFIREYKSPSGCKIAILQDLSGPKIRLGKLKNQAEPLHKGQVITLTTRRVEGADGIYPINYKKLPQEISERDPALLDDGAIRLRVLSTDKHDIQCKVLSNGLISSHKGINLPRTRLSVAPLTKKDRLDLEFGLKNDVDFVALSFVRKAENIRQLKKLISKAGKHTPVIAKIEKREALDDLHRIIEEADGVMVARGDLGVEIKLERVPLAQKRIIELSNRFGKPVITATQMLESMVHNPQPTRAEVTDVANAILDGTDAVMLSGETAIGKYPERAVRMMNKIALVTEKELRKEVEIEKRGQGNAVADAVCHAVSILQSDLKLKAIVACTISGATARMIARYRPRVPILAATPVPEVARRLSLTWGVQPVEVQQYNNAEQMVQQTLDTLVKNKWLRKGDRIAMVSGLKIGTGGGIDHISVITI